MCRNIIFILCIAVLLAGCASESRTITIQTTHEGELAGFYLAGNETATIDWGDGTPIETVDLAPLTDNYFDVYDNAEMRFLHTYSTSGVKIITVTGSVTGLYIEQMRDVTALDISKNRDLLWLYCRMSNLSMLDVSQNTALIGLDCFGNKISALDVSKNTALAILYCGGNNLSTLNLSQNTALTRLDCSMNNFSTLDVSKNTALTKLDCENNNLTHDVLIAIFNALPKHDDEDEATINCCYNPGYDALTASDKAIAEVKNWKLYE